MIEGYNRLRLCHDRDKTWHLRQRNRLFSKPHVVDKSDPSCVDSSANEDVAGPLPAVSSPPIDQQKTNKPAGFGPAQVCPHQPSESERTAPLSRYCRMIRRPAKFLIILGT